MNTYGQKKAYQDTVSFQLKTELSKNHQIDIKNYLQSIDTTSAPVDRARIYNEIAITYIKASYYLGTSISDSIYHYSNKALLLTEKKKSDRDLFKQYLIALNNIAWSYKEAGNHIKALEFFNRTLKETKQIKRPIDFYTYRQNATTGAALIYEAQSNFKLAIEQYRSLLTYVDENNIDKKNISSIIYIYLARFFGELDEVDKAIIYANKGLKVSITNKMPEREALAYLELASLKLKQKEYQKVAFFLSEAYTILKDSELVILLSKYYLIKAYLADASGAIYQKIDYAEKAFELEGKKSVTRRQVVIGQLLSDAYKEVKDYKKALAYQEKTVNIEKALTNNEEVRKSMLLALEKKDVSLKLEQAKNQMKSRIIIIILLLFIIGFITALSIYNDRKKKVILTKIIKQKNEELNELNQTKSRLFTNISHELRTPLTLISGPIDQLLNSNRETLEITATSKLEMIKENVTSLKNLVNDILDLSKLDASKLELTQQSIHLENTLTKITGKFISLAEKNDINFTINLEGIKGHIIVTDTLKLEKIINNLLSNAFKHTPSKESIHIVATRENSLLNIIVRDTGLGIPEKDVPKIFDRYFQSSDPTKPLEGGSGIGLSLVKELVALMKGEITVESQVGKGSSFTLTIPVTEAIVNDTESFDEEENDSSLEIISLEHLTLPKNYAPKEFTILIVEDHAGMQKFITSVLDKKYNLIIATNGEEALERLKNTTPVDLIISDVMMPIMDGFTLLENIKQSDDYYDIPVIMLTALVETDHKLKALTLGVDDYLSKPFDTKELLARTYNLISRYQQRKQEKGERYPMTDQGIATTPENINPSESLIENDYLQNKGDIKLIEQVAQIIEANLENPTFKLSDLTKHVYLEERQLRTKIKMTTGLTPKKFQQEIILLKARKLLENETYGSVKAVAISVGMTHVTRFSRLYEARFGKHPNRYFKDVGFSIKKTG
ncbi:ATP-binding protein [Dokdonia ponticola]|uniref:histidine kinase n=1 Tax=Dokdonia ponticola TaxID=2041041 RepID=A0ABV9HUA9_9FLAO